MKKWAVTPHPKTQCTAQYHQLGLEIS
jgi:hypothetical protein